MVKVKEIFTSIQGEGPYVGYKQLFIRFCGCNLSCKYCDTEFSAENSKEYSIEDLIKICHDNKDCHSVSLTGGEPLLNVEFLEEFLPKCTLPVYLETNATLVENLAKIIDYVNYIAADIKLESSTGMKDLFEIHDKFFSIASAKKLFAKVVFGNNLTDGELRKACELCKKYNVEMILQPIMFANKMETDTDYISEVLNSALGYYTKVRFIPQIHKFIDVK